MNKIFIVKAISGVGLDVSHWCVAWHHTKEQAEEHVRLLTSITDLYQDKMNYDDASDEFEKHCNLLNVSLDTQLLNGDLYLFVDELNGGISPDLLLNQTMFDEVDLTKN